MMIAHLDREGGIGVTMLAHLLACRPDYDGQFTLVDGAPENPALDRLQQPTWEGFPCLSGVMSLAQETLHQEVPALAGSMHKKAFDGSSHVVGLTRSRLLMPNPVAVPQSWPFDDWAAEETLDLVGQASVFRPLSVTCFELNRCGICATADMPHALSDCEFRDTLGVAS